MTRRQWVNVVHGPPIPWWRPLARRRFWIEWDRLTISGDPNR